MKALACSGILVCVCLSRAAVAIAAIQPYYATAVVREGTVWANLAGAHSGPGSSCAEACSCTAGQCARNGTPGNTDRLTATDFEPYVHVPGSRINLVRFDAHGRYDSATDGGNFRARIVVKNTAGVLVWDSGTITPGNSFANANCRWRFPDAYRDITSAVDWNADPSLINGIELSVWRNGNSNPMWVNAFKIEVDTQPLPPMCLVSPSSADFGGVAVGAAADNWFTVRNVGGGVLSVSIPSGCGPFSVEEGAGSYQLGPSATHNVRVRFSPTCVGQTGCSISTGCADPYDVTGSGTGAVCEVWDLPLELRAGVNATVSQSFRVFNRGCGTLSGAASLVGCQGLGLQLGAASYSGIAPGSTHDIRLIYTPSQIGQWQCAVDVGCGQVVPVNLTGVPSGGCCEFQCRQAGIDDCDPALYAGDGTTCADCPISSISGDDQAIDSVDVGRFAKATIVVRNVGGGQLSGTLEEQSDDSQSYFVLADPRVNLGAGESKTFEVVFGPRSLVHRASASFELASPTPIPGSTIVELEGNANSVACAFSPSMLVFEPVAAGQTREMSITLSNPHPYATIVGAVTTVGCADFSVVGSGAYSILPHSSTSVTVQYTSSGQITPYAVIRADGCGDEALAVAGLPAATSVESTLVPITETVLRGAAPSPFRNVTGIQFELAKPSTAVVSVYDLAGRLVRLVFGGSLPSGRHWSVWDGCDGRGQAVSAGIYIVRLQADGVSQSQRVVRLR